MLRPSTPTFLLSYRGERVERGSGRHCSSGGASAVAMALRGERFAAGQDAPAGLRRGDFVSLVDLEAAVNRSIAPHNDEPRPSSGPSQPRSSATNSTATLNQPKEPVAASDKESPPSLPPRPVTAARGFLWYMPCRPMRGPDLEGGGLQPVRRSTGAGARPGARRVLSGARLRPSQAQPAHSCRIWRVAHQPLTT
jgi:hypothetical protein